MRLSCLVAGLFFFACTALIESARAQDSSTTPETSKQTVIVCFGDSITARGYPAVLAKNLNVSVINAGVSGNSTKAGLARMKKDVLDQKPLIVVILFGTNDSRVDDPVVCVPLDKYEANLNEMVESCQKNSSQVILCILPPIDQEAYFKRHDRKKIEEKGGLDAILTSYREVQAKVADRYKLPVVDLNKILGEHPEWRDSDGVHPTKEGNALIAQEIGKVAAPLLENIKSKSSAPTPPP